MTNPSTVQRPYKHILEEDVIKAKDQNRKPSLLKDMKNAKLILQECSGDTGDSVYDHLSEIIKRIIDERPTNVIDYFEDFSRHIRNERLQPQTNTSNNLQQTYIEPKRIQIAKDLLKCLTLPSPENFPGDQLLLQPSTSTTTMTTTTDTDTDDDNDHNRKEKNLQLFLNTDFIHLQFYWSLAGYGFPKNEIYLLSCAIRKLEENSIVKNCRFWGKIFGLKKNYYIIECTLTAIEIKKRRSQEQSMLNAKILNNIQLKEEFRKSNRNTMNKIQGINFIPNIPLESKNKFDSKVTEKERRLYTNIPLPPSLSSSDLYRIPKEIPNELYGKGLNRKTYFVCNELTEDWQELPAVQPKQISISRQITKYFTGNLLHEINSYPEFPGNEQNYLRAIIARITASTYISPNKFYRIGKDMDREDKSAEKEEEGEEEEEEEEEEEDYDDDQNNDKEVTLNLDYKPMNYKDLLKINSWSHHRPNILPQGRINWCKPKRFDKLLTSDNEEDEDDDEEEEEEEEEAEEEEEKGTEGGDESKVKIKDHQSLKIGPKLMQSCSMDYYYYYEENKSTSPWTIRTTQMYNRNKNTMVIVKSNIWPGSITFSQDTIHDNLYIGWGNKLMGRNYSPSSLPFTDNQCEYKIGPEIMEINDPTIEVEQEYWNYLREKNLPSFELNENLDETIEGELNDENEEEINDEDEEDDDDEEEEEEEVEEGSDDEKD